MVEDDDGLIKENYSQPGARQLETEEAGLLSLRILYAIQGLKLQGLSWLGLKG